MVGTYDKIKVSKLYSHCMPVQFMHTCLTISLHGVVLFFGDYRIRRQIYVSKPPMHAASQYVTMVARSRGFVA